MSDGSTEDLSRPFGKVKDIPDLTVYAALVGHDPEIDPALADPAVVAATARREHPWSPVVFGVYIGHVARQKVMEMNRPDIAAWINRQRDTARRRFAETQLRLRKKKAA